MMKARTTSRYLAPSSYDQQIEKLYEAIIEGSWSKVLANLPEDGSPPNISNGKTPLHIAMEVKQLQVAEKLIQITDVCYLSIQDDYGYTCLSIAIIHGCHELVETLIKKSPSLLNIGEDGKQPMELALIHGKKTIIQLIYNSAKDTGVFYNMDHHQLLLKFIKGGLYGLGADLVYVGDLTREEKLDALTLLASCGNTCFAANKISEMLMLFKLLLDQITSVTRGELVSLWFEAAKSGFVQIVRELDTRYPLLKLESNDKNQTVVHVAAEHRHIEILRIPSIRRHMVELASRVGPDQTNILHLVAQLAPLANGENELGVALKMNRELQWFEEVKKLVPQSYMDLEGGPNNQKPQDVFDEQHQQLLADAKSWVKSTALHLGGLSVFVATMSLTSLISTVLGDRIKGARHKIYIALELFALFCALCGVLACFNAVSMRSRGYQFIKEALTTLVVELTLVLVAMLAMMSGLSFSLYTLYDHGVMPLPIITCALGDILALYFIYKQLPVLLSLMRIFRF